MSGRRFVGTNRLWHVAIVAAAVGGVVCAGVLFDKLDKLDFWQLLVSILGFYSATYVLVQRNDQERREYEWRRKQYSAQFTHEWTSITSGLRSAMESSEFGDLWNEHDPLSLAAVDKKRIAVDSDERCRRLREAVITYLNWLDDFAYLYRTHMIDRAVVTELLAPALRLYHGKVDPLAKAIAWHNGGAKQRPNKAWSEYYDFAHENEVV
ncbi:MAG: hypothetical protein ACRCT8_00530 [Lacipirellulaceae bacterium]